MNWTRSSKFAALLVVLLALAAVSPAAAVSTKATSVPTTAQVGTQQTAAVTVSDLYKDPNLQSWTLHGQTNLTDVTWTVTFYNQAGDQVGQQSHDGQSFNQSGVNLKDGVSQVKVRVQGTVPEVGHYSYDPAQSITLLSLAQTRKGGTTNALKRWTVRPYTSKSKQARTAIDSASSSLQSAKSAGADVSEAKSSLSDAVAAYDGGNFDLAVNLAQKADQKATAAQKSAKSSKNLNSILLYGGAGVVVLIVVVGGLFWYRSQQDSYDKLG